MSENDRGSLRMEVGWTRHGDIVVFSTAPYIPQGELSSTSSRLHLGCVVAVVEGAMPCGKRRATSEHVKGASVPAFPSMLQTKH